jgi:hypothetical protein
MTQKVMKGLETGRITHVSDAGKSHQVANHGDRYTESKFVVAKNRELVRYAGEDVLQQSELQTH